MSGKNKQNSILERWEIDAKAYKNGAKNFISIPQCETCTNYIRGNVLHCQCYYCEQKPRYVLFPEKECNLYNNNTPINLKIENDKENKIYGGLFGFCIGDVLGVPVEFSLREDRKRDPVMEMRAYGTYHQPFGTWSDDTSLTICLIDAFNKGYSIKKVAENFVNYFEKGYFTPYGEVFDIVNSTKDAILKLSSGINPVDCGGTLDTDNGNGSLMRILPIAFWGQKLSDRELIKVVEEVSSLTHGHQRSKLACIFYVEFVIQLLLEKDKKEALDITIDFIQKHCDDSYSYEFKNLRRILEKHIIYLTEDEINSTGYVVDTLEAVLWTFFHTENYRDTILKAINLGGDTDTIAAIVGGIAGVYYGFNDIPNNWVQSIAKKEELHQMFKHFVTCIQ